MFKKNLWIVGLLMGLAIMFVGCIDAEVEEGGDDLEEVEIFNMSTDAGIQALAKGNLTFADGEDGNPIAPLVKAGEIGQHLEYFQAVAGPNGISLKYKTTVNWGPGVDLRQAAFGFREGDEVTVTGSISGGDAKEQLNSAIGAENAVASFEGTGAFELKATLTAANIGQIKGGNPAGIRIETRTTGVVVQIDNIIIKGLRKPGEGLPEPEPEITNEIEGAGDYDVPTTALALGTYWVDLNTAVIGELTPAGHFPEAKIAAAGLTVDFDWNTQTIFVPFTDDLGNVIINSAKLGYTYNVTIDATGAGHIRYCIGADRGSNWNPTSTVGDSANGMPGNANFSTILTHSFKVHGDPEALNGFVFQSRPLNNANNEAMTTPWTMLIKSIKVEIVPSGSTALTPVTTVSFDIFQPLAGLPAPTSVSGTNWTGDIVWVPALPKDGRFERSVIYMAKIYIYGKAGYYIDKTATVNIGGDAVKDDYDAIGRVAYTEYFDVTDPFFAPLPTGVLFDLSEWLETNTTMGWPLQLSGSPTIVVDKDDGITVSGITADYHAVDILLDKIDAKLNPSFYKVKIEVEGKILALSGTNTGATVKIGGSAGSYTTLKQLDDLEEDDVFSLVCDEIPANFVGANSNTVRIQGNGTVFPGSFVITKIIVTNLGER